MKIVKEAYIEIISLRNLKIGDYILWSNMKRKVVDIDYKNKKVKLNNSYNENLIDEYDSYIYYYKIIESKEEYSKTICDGCGEVIDKIEPFNFCTPICKDKFEESISNLGVY